MLQTNAQSILSPRDKQRLRCKFYRKKSNVLTMFCEEKEYNICMLLGEINVLQDVNVFSANRADELRTELLDILTSGFHIYTLKELQFEE